MSTMDVPADQPVARAEARTKVPATAWISWVALAMMTTSSVASLRAAPTMAVYGLACVFLYVIPAIVFLIPTSLVSAELASGWKGGVYNWVSLGISKPMGFLAVFRGRERAAADWKAKARESLEAIEDADEREVVEGDLATLPI